MKCCENCKHFTQYYIKAVDKFVAPRGFGRCGNGLKLEEWCTEWEQAPQNNNKQLSLNYIMDIAKKLKDALDILFCD